MRPVTRDRRGRLPVLIVTGSAGLAGAFQMALQQAGLATDLAGSGAEAIARQSERPAAVVVVDVALPDMHGETLLARLAEARQSAVIAIAGDAHEARRLRERKGIADDVVAQPVAPKSLAARVLALRQRRARPGEGHGSPLVMIDRTGSALVDAHGRRTRLERAELAVLTTLLDAEGASVSGDWLARVALGKMPSDGEAELRDLMAELRRKLAAHGVASRVIRSARGKAYVIADPTAFAAGPDC